MNSKYENMLDMPHYEPRNHPRMTMEQRAAQFAPFAALTGYSAAIAETGRLTGSRVVLEEDDLQALDRRMSYLKEHLKDCPEVEFTYFKPDALKDGGEYVTVTGTVKKIDEPSGTVFLTSGERIPASDILDLDGEIFVFDTEL